MGVLARAIYALHARLSNPTRRWPRAAVERMELDLPAGRLNGIPLGGPLDALRSLGPATGIARIGRVGLDLHYSHLGLEVGLWEGEIVHFRLMMSPSAWFRPTPFTPAAVHVVVPGGRSFLLGRETTERALREWLGPPASAEETDVYGPSRSLSFHVGRCLVDAFTDLPGGRVIEIEVGGQAASSPGPGRR